LETTSRGRWRTLAAAIVASLTIGAAAPAQAQAPAAPATAPAPPAAARPAPPRIFVSADGGGQFASAGFTSQTTFSLYAETATIVATFPDASGAAAAVRGSVRVWRGLGLGAGATGFWSTRPAEITASLPHPFFFDRERSVEGTATGLSRDEKMVAVEGSWVFPVTARMDVQVFAGPAFFSVRADIPTGVQFTESYPYDEAAFGSATSASVSGSATGFTLGGDVTYLFTPSIGIGGHLRFSRATATLTPPGGQASSVELGGVQAGGGLRFRF
jgi:opacity protein-like surface antigen